MDKVIITGYPYVYPYYFKVFEYAENKNDIIFILPKHWEAKNGKVKMDLIKHSGFRVYGLSTRFYGGKSLLAGLFKGWIPTICFMLPFLRFKYGSRVLYSCLEPNLLTTFYNGFFAKLFGYKHILFTWQNVFPEKRMSGLKLKCSNALVKLNLVFADGIICGNKKAAEIVRRFKIPDSRLKILVSPLSGVDTEKFKSKAKSDWREKLGIKNEEKIVLFYGALEKRKGLNILVEAFKMLITNYQLPIIKLIVVGTGPEKQNLESRIKNYELSDKVIFLDWMSNNELPALLNSADVFVYPSVPFGGWEEQFGYAMAEASACNVPVVATKTGSISEVIIDGKSGLLVEPNDPKQLVGAIYKILSDKELAIQMGEFGRDHIIKNFSHQVVAKKLTSFLV